MVSNVMSYSVKIPARLEYDIKGIIFRERKFLLAMLLNCHRLCGGSTLAFFALSFLGDSHKSSKASKAIAQAE